jgi:2-polyprenyl-3-methyl-5-hydroxy-6-metoxy-1,4-benzoquinol methylase/glycosyltransferase involved in cell wall biosynthesis
VAEIVIACGAMPFGPDTLKYKSLGGSETAALMLAKELVKRGHFVTMFCNLPEPGQPDHIGYAGVGEDGVRYIHLNEYKSFAEGNESDLTIITRDPMLCTLLTQTKKKVLWMHDIATKRGMARAFEQMAWSIDEVWTVSEWHRQQVHKVTGYPLDRIKATRNGIVRVDTIPAPRSETQLIYAARPERGLDNLIMPGGIMDNLPEYTLKVCMYAHFPEHMREYYQRITQRMKEMPNVEFLGPKPQAELRQIIRDSAAYIYPTQFEETSCILARECVEQRTPFFTTKVGALPETLGLCGIYFEDWLDSKGLVQPAPGSPGWALLFAQFFREAMKHPDYIEHKRKLMGSRTDLYWDDVAAWVEQNMTPEPAKWFSRAWSLIQDGDVIPARAFLENTSNKLFNPMKPTDPELGLSTKMLTEIADLYPFILTPDDPRHISIGDYYERIYSSKKDTPNSELTFHADLTGGARFQAIADMLRKMPPGQRVLEYGSGAGHLLATLAKHVPQHDYTGIEISPSAVKSMNDGAQAFGMTNLRAYVGDTKNLPEVNGAQDAQSFDVVICSEVLEHVTEPWSLLTEVEEMCRPGGRIIVTVPIGPWEQGTFHDANRWKERAHIWHIDKWMLRKMCPDKPNPMLVGSINGIATEGRPFGNIIFSYDANHVPCQPIDPLEKALEARPRHTVAAGVIAYNNEDTIKRMLDSVDHQVQFVQIAHGPSMDDTRAVIDKWASEHPWTYVNVIDVPKIEVGKFGFDDARNSSVDCLEKFCEWVLWIDTDEYLSGDFRKYLRHSAVDSYIIPQHHFTVVPRGGEIQIDRPARLFRSDRGFRAVGHIHEHFEMSDGGPGRVWLLPDVDLGHTGYVNEDVRRERFKRNFPFLEWDHHEQLNGEKPERKLHKFLWLRDIVHRMRFALQENDQAAGVALAKEAVRYYNEHWKEMMAFGPGLAMSLQYLSEANLVLNQGVDMQIALRFDDRSTTLAGRFNDYAQVQRLIEYMVSPEFTERLDKYY